MNEVNEIIKLESLELSASGWCDVEVQVQYSCSDDCFMEAHIIDMSVESVTAYDGEGIGKNISINSLTKADDLTIHKEVQRVLDR